MKKILAVSALALLATACSQSGTSTCMHPNYPPKNCHEFHSKDKRMQCAHMVNDGALTRGGTDYTYEKPVEAKKPAKHKKKHGKKR